MNFLFSHPKRKEKTEGVEKEEQNGFASWVAIFLLSLMRMREFTNSHTYKHLKYNSQQVSEVFLFGKSGTGLKWNGRKNDSFSRFMPLPSTRHRYVQFHYAIGPVSFGGWSGAGGKFFLRFFHILTLILAYLSFPVSTNQIYFLCGAHTITRTHAPFYGLCRSLLLLLLNTLGQPVVTT